MLSIKFLRLRLRQNDTAPQQWKKSEPGAAKKLCGRISLGAIFNHFFMLNISSKQELSEPHRFTAPAPPDDAARCGSIRLQLLHR
jgi:hypothetical protein